MEKTRYVRRQWKITPHNYKGTEEATAFCRAAPRTTLCKQTFIPGTKTYDGRPHMIVQGSDHEGKRAWSLFKRRLTTSRDNFKSRLTTSKADWQLQKTTDNSKSRLTTSRADWQFQETTDNFERRLTTSRADWQLQETTSRDDWQLTVPATHQTALPATQTACSEFLHVMT